MTSVNSTCNVTLTCSVEKEEKNVTYSWSPLGEEGNVLRVFQTPDNQELTYTCTAWNPVSNNSDSISAQQLCAGNHLCPSLLKSQNTLTCCKAWISPSSPGKSASLIPRLDSGEFSSQEALEQNPKPSGWCRAFQGVLRQPPLSSPIQFLILTFNSRKYSFPLSFGTPLYQYWVSFRGVPLNVDKFAQPLRPISWESSLTTSSISRHRSGPPYSPHWAVEWAGCVLSASNHSTFSDFVPFAQKRTR